MFPCGITFTYGDKIVVADYDGRFLSRDELNEKLYIPNDEEIEERNVILKRVNENINKMSHGDIKSKQKGYIYVIKSLNKYKIGKTKNLKNRMRKYITESPEPIEVILTENINDYTKCETELHKKLLNKNYNREWYDLDDSDFDIIKNIINKYK